MKKLLLITLFIYLNLASFSQNLRLGIENGSNKSIFSISNAADFLKPSMFDFPKNVNITVNYSFENNIFLKSGIGYYAYSDIIPLRTRIGIENHFMEYFVEQNCLYKSITIPLQIGY